MPTLKKPGMPIMDHSGKSWEKRCFSLIKEILNPQGPISRVVSKTVEELKELEQTEEALIVIKAYRKILNTIGNNNFHWGIEDELKVSFCNIKFKPLLYKSPHLITFQNSTLDLKTNEFRPS